MTPNVMTLITTKLSKEALSIMMLRMTTFSKKTFCIMTVSTIIYVISKFSLMMTLYKALTLESNFF